MILSCFMVMIPEPEQDSKLKKETREDYDLEFNVGIPGLFCKYCGCQILRAAAQSLGPYYCLNHVHLQVDEVVKHEK